MNVQPLFDLKPHNPTNWREKVRSASFDERQIIQWIMRLYLDGKPFDADVTYSLGRLWSGLPKPRITMDIDPKSRSSIISSVTNLPVRNKAWTSAFIDPPYQVAPTPKPGIIRDRFGWFRTVQELWSFYERALAELHRVLRDGGLLCFKIQDMVSNSGQHWSHIFVANTCEALGFTCEDMFILLNDRVLWSPNMANQQHARKIHSYFLVFRKPGTRP